MLKNNIIYLNKNKNLDFYLIGFLLILAFYLGEFSPKIEESVEAKSNGAFLVVTNLIFFAITFKKQRFFFRTLLFNKFFLAYLFTLFILVFLRIDMLKELRNFIQILLTYMLVFQVSAVMYSIGIVRLIKYLSNYLTLVLLLCLLVYLKNYGRIYFFEHEPEKRLGGLFFIGTTAIIAGFCILINVFLYSIKINRVFTLCKIIFSFVILFATDTRMVIFITIVCSAMILLWKYRKSILIFAIVLSIIYVIYDNFIKHDYINQVETDYEFRTFIWSASILKISEQFWIGYGTENPFKNITNSTIDYLQDPHSAYLSIVLRQGFIAATLLFIFYYKKIMFNSSLFSIFILYYFLSVIVGTEIFLGSLSYLNFIFNITLFGLLLHPDLKKNIVKKKYVNIQE